MNELNFEQLLEQAQNTTIKRDRTGAIKQAYEQGCCYVAKQHNKQNKQGYSYVVVNASLMNSQLRKLFKLNDSNNRQQLNATFGAMLEQLNEQGLKQAFVVFANNYDSNEQEQEQEQQ